MSSSASLQSEPSQAAAEDPTEGSPHPVVAAGHARQTSPTSDTSHPRPATFRRRRRIPAGLFNVAAVRAARLIRAATSAVCVLIVLGIVFYVLDANTHKWLVSDVDSIGRWAASPFQNTFMLHTAKLALALNWGIAVVVYSVLGRLLARVVQGLPARLARVRS